MVDKIIQFLKKFKIEFCENFDISALSSIKGPVGLSRCLGLGHGVAGSWQGHRA